MIYNTWIDIAIVNGMVKESLQKSQSQKQMGYKIVTLQNTSGYDSQKPTIKITDQDEDWTIAYKNWIENKPPTDDPRWEMGIFALTEKI